MTGTSGDAPRKYSRVLAALEDSSGNVNVPQLSQAPNALKRKFSAASSNYESPGEASAKRIGSASQSGASMNCGEGAGGLSAEI